MFLSSETVIYGQNACLTFLDFLKQDSNCLQQYQSIVRKIYCHRKKIPKINRYGLSFPIVPIEKELWIHSHRERHIAIELSATITPNIRRAPYPLKDFLFGKSQIVVLDHLQDPQNLGAILRTAYAFGIDGAILPERRSASINPTVHHVSMAASLMLPIYMTKNIANTIKQARKFGFIGIGLDVRGHVVNSLDFLSNEKWLLVLGSEHRGMAKHLDLDYTVAFAMRYPMESVNVAAAFAYSLGLMHRPSSHGKGNFS